MDNGSRLQYLSACLMYRLYKILALLTWGEVKEHIKNQKRVLKYKLRLMK